MIDIKKKTFTFSLKRHSGIKEVKIHHRSHIVYIALLAFVVL